MPNLVAAVYHRRKQRNRRSQGAATRCLFYDFERGPLTVARGRTRQQRANSMNRLAISADDAADIALPKLQLKDAGSAARNLREHHVVGKFNQLPNHELKKLSHDQNKLTTNERESTRIFA